MCTNVKNYLSMSKNPFMSINVPKYYQNVQKRINNFESDLTYLAKSETFCEFVSFFETRNKSRLKR